MTRLRVVNNYGGKGPFTIPKDHVPAIRVPKGGSCCKNCIFVDAKNHECKNANYIEWNGSPALPPLPLDEICSDWYDWPGASEHAKNPPLPGYYVWTLNRRGEVVGQSISGPHAELQARTKAASDARRSQLDRAVSRGAQPKAENFAFVGGYEAGTGRKFF